MMKVSSFKSFEEYLSPEEAITLTSLNTPAKIQGYLDQTLYSAEDINRTPLQVMQDRVAHCLDGALFAAAALRCIGHDPILVDLFPDPGMDDDHVLAVYRVAGNYGALAKSNFTGLRFREPVYRNLRELVLSYFELFFNVDGIKTFRTYTRLLHLKQYDSHGWTWNSKGVIMIERRLLTMPRIALLTPEMAAKLSPVDQISYQAGMLFVNPAGLYKPGILKQ